MSEVTYNVSLEIRDMVEEDLTNPRIIEFCKILEESPESVLLDGWDINLGSFQIDDAETSMEYWVYDDYFSLILEQNECSPTERLLLEWLLKNNHSKLLIYNLILEKEP